MKYLWVLLAFVIQFFTVKYVYFQLGYDRALHVAEQQFYAGPEGYCLADSPPHAGECHEPDTNGRRDGRS